MSYYDEFLVSRHPLFSSKIKMAEIIGFGKSKNFHGARGAAIGYYTKISYYEQDKEYMAKIFRSMDDEVGNKIAVAVEADGKLATRYKKCNWYGEGYGAKRGGAPGLIMDMCMYAFIHIITACWLVLNFEASWKIYFIYILTVILHYLFLPQIVKIRNLIWEKEQFKDL